MMFRKAKTTAAEIGGILTGIPLSLLNLPTITPPEGEDWGY